MQKIYNEVAKRVNLPISGVSATIKLLDEGATIPFICRYRKELTGSFDEIQVRAIETALKSVRELENRKEFVRGVIEKDGKLTPELSIKISATQTINELEDIYLPFKPKKHSRASKARERGLEPFAKMIMSGCTDCKQLALRFVGKNDILEIEDAINGASDIIAEWASESTRLRQITRNHFNKTAVIVCSKVKGKEAELLESQYAQYSEFSQQLRRVLSHQYLAIKRAEREGLLKVKLDIENEALHHSLCSAFTPSKVSNDSRTIIEKAVLDALKRLIRPSVENEISTQLKEKADKHAIEIFTQNLRQLLLGSPLKGKRILSIDPGFRTGCKVVALDEQGNLLDDSVIYPVAPQNDTVGSKQIVSRLIKTHKLDLIALGNGTASRETEKFLKDSFKEERIPVFVVSEDGASVYSASEIGRKEFPDKDITVRGAVSIGRRLIDPLAELVKIDPKSIGVGQYQHDVDQKSLKDSLDFTVISCVNSVGVDVNTASECLLSYVSGIGPALATNIVNYRRENGNFLSRRALKNVPRLGDKAYELAAGFLRVANGKNPLDNTGIHPESYNLVDAMASSIGVRTEQLLSNNDFLERINVKELAARGIGGEQTMLDIIAELRKPGRDPRQTLEEFSFAEGVNSIEDLKEGMVLPGIVTNITNFGAFVDIGVHQDGLVHISQMADKYVSDPMQVVILRQQVTVRIQEIDFQRRRISLSMRGL